MPVRSVVRLPKTRPHVVHGLETKKQVSVTKRHAPAVSCAAGSRSHAKKSGLWNNQFDPQRESEDQG
jgi:hypothetical protein